MNTVHGRGRWGVFISSRGGEEDELLGAALHLVGGDHEPEVVQAEELELQLLELCHPVDRLNEVVELVEDIRTFA